MHTKTIKKEIQNCLLGLIFLYRFFCYIKTFGWILSKKERKACERYQDLSEDEKTKSVSILVNDEVFSRKKKKTKRQNDWEWYKKLQEYEKQREVE